MATTQLFRKKKLKNETENPEETSISLEKDEVTETKDLEKGLQSHEEVGEDTRTDDEDEGTVRMSFDLPRKTHKVLRIASIHCERTIVDMIGEMIERTLLHRELDSIAADYHVKQKVRSIKIR